MTYEMYRYIFYICLIMSFVMLILTVFIAIIFRIPSVIGNLTGLNAKKAIDRIRRKNELDDVMADVSINTVSKRVTDKISNPNKYEIASIKTKNNSCNVSFTQQLLSADVTSRGAKENVMSSCGVSEETTLLEQYSNDIGERVVLDDVNRESLFYIERDITYIHTNEIIE